MIKIAAESFRRGEILLIHDDEKRENEVDMVLCARHSTPYKIKQMRKDAGGLICVALGNEIAKTLGLVFMHEIYASSTYRFLSSLLHPLPYRSTSAFSITVNHIKTFTGITDNDRSLTITALSSVKSKDEFLLNFRSPGHVPLLIEHEGGLEKRRGHTELALAIARMAGERPIAVLCEMLGEDGNALDADEARKYALRKNLVYIEGKEIADAFETSTQA
ncbi:MAG: 3,4-dihydroxy-2-butanone-4-phosphate synthase [Candidatus Micrarchaeia archaeon]